MKTWRWLTLMLAALCMGTTWAHLLEMPAKIKLDGPTWLMLLLQTIYPPMFGTVGAFFEVGAPIAAVAPVNAMLVPLTADTLPPSWSALRDQWEYTHAARALLQLAGLGFLVFSVVCEIPKRFVDSAGAGSS